MDDFLPLPFLVFFPFLDFFEEDFLEPFPDFFFTEREEEDFPFFLYAAEESVTGISIVIANNQMSHTYLKCLRIFSLNYRISMQGGKW